MKIQPNFPPNTATAIKPIKPLLIMAETLTTRAISSISSISLGLVNQMELSNEFTS